MPLTQREPPKRGAKCDHCGAPATGLFYQWHGCEACIEANEATTERWAADRLRTAISPDQARPDQSA